MTENEQKLLSGLKALAAAETAGPPPQLEAALLKRLNRRKKVVVSWPLVLEVLAAAAILILAISSRPEKPVADGFIAVPYAAPLGQYERTEVVRVNVSLAALAQWGLPVSNASAGQRINAEVVLGEDGLARAVRFVNNE